MILGLLTLLQVSAAPAPQGPVPRVTLNQAIARASRLDPDYVRALGQVDNAEWGRRAALAVLILPSLTASIAPRNAGNPATFSMWPGSSSCSTM